MHCRLQLMVSVLSLNSRSSLDRHLIATIVEIEPVPIFMIVVILIVTILTEKKIAVFI